MVNETFWRYLMIINIFFTSYVTLVVYLSKVNREMMKKQQQQESRLRMIGKEKKINKINNKTKTEGHKMKRDNIK